MEPINAYGAGFAAAKDEKRRIWLLGSLSGGAVLLYIFLQNLLVGALSLVELYEAYASNSLMQAGVDILLVLSCLLLPFLLLEKPMARISGNRNALMLDAPGPKADVVPAVFAGIGFCVAANLVTGYLTQFITDLGVELSAPDLPMPSGVLGVTASVFRVVVVAALTEELCFRGVVMGHLRRFGDFFAVAMASVVFALMHCNLIQAPFALIVGFALGYLCIRTGSLWTGIAVHALNNSISLVFSYLLERYDEPTINFVYTVLIYALMAAGALGVCVLLVRRRPRPAQPQCALGFGAKTFWFFFNPPMLAALGLMVWFTAQYVS